MGVGAATVAHDDEAHIPSGGAGGGDEAAAAEALVVGMRRHDDEASPARQVRECPNRQAGGRGEELACRHDASRPARRR